MNRRGQVLVKEARSTVADDDGAIGEWASPMIRLSSSNFTLAVTERRQHVAEVHVVVGVPVVIGPVVHARSEDLVDHRPVFDGPIDDESFRILFEKVLVPTLRPGDIVIMDNLASYKAKAVRQLIRAARAKPFFLPKYSPDLNPIEQVFAKLKHLLRKAAARSAETICVTIGEILRAFTPTECANYFRNSGYAQS
jgi:transposase